MHTSPFCLRLRQGEILGSGDCKQDFAHVLQAVESAFLLAEGAEGPRPQAPLPHTGTGQIPAHGSPTVDRVGGWTGAINGHAGDLRLGRDKHDGE